MQAACAARSRRCSQYQNTKPAPKNPAWPNARCSGLALSSVWISAGLALGLLVCLNKVENDIVHVARHYAGMTQVADVESVRVPQVGLLRTARRAARLVPFHRMFHSIEMSLLILLAAVVDLFVDGTATRVLLLAMLASAVVTVVGHLVAVLGSSRLR